MTGFGPTQFAASIRVGHSRVKTVDSFHRKQLGRPFRGQNGQLVSLQSAGSTIPGTKWSTRFTESIRVGHFDVKTVNSIHRKQLGRPFPGRNGRPVSPQVSGSTISGVMSRKWTP
ncbi:MAG: hypothetical protein U5K84_05730 [Alkalibacterium sp.]|nr:hypothetical protein [Alkalibacterium sp.]